MSGICGIIEPACLPDGSQRISAMLDAMRHRGQDGRGQAQPIDNVFLGCVHQADIDTQPNGSQPLVDPDTGNILLFNGEIYNFKELQGKLTRLGKAFATGSDAEVLLMAYAQWGEKCLYKLRGVFAFAIWNQKERKLFAARDTVGVMPFYYYRDGLRFVFASEVRAMLASRCVTREVDRSGLESMLAYGSLQEPFTLVKGVRSLPPGCYFELKSREPFICHPFTHEDFAPWTMPESHIADILRENLLASVRMYSFADVQKCLLFDGGLGSMALASVMKDAQVSMPAYYFSWNTNASQEGRRELAKKLKLDYEILRMEEPDLRQNFTKALDSYDQPSTRGVETWYVTQMLAGRGMHVTLSGLGLRQLFIRPDCLRRVQNLSREAYIMRHFPPWILRVVHSLFNYAGIRQLCKLGTSAYPPYFLLRRLLDDENCIDLMGTNPKARPRWFNLMTANLQLHHFTKDVVNMTSYLELATFLRSALLRNADQLGRSNGIELRTPFLDTVVVNTLLKTPGSMKSDSRNPYCLLLNAARIPDNLLSLKQQRLSFPVRQYMDELCSKEIEELFHIAPLDCMNSVSLVSLWKEYHEGRCPWQFIWAVYLALRWISRHL